MTERENPELELENEPEEENDEPGDSVMIEPFDPNKINVQPKQDTLYNIINRLRNDEIDMNTDFQRHADLWLKEKMSRLIESILIRFPLPAFYFDASNDDKWLIVDGLQRLSSIRKFVVEKDLRLKGLEYLTDLSGKSYEDLSRAYQRRIDECPITLFQILPGTPEEVKYSIFRRINTGGLVLNNQEVRNALAGEKERKFLEKLANDENLIRTMGDQSKRMLDQELVLRFIAFFTQDYFKSRKNIAEFLDDAMEALKSSSASTLQNLEAQFKRAVSLCFQIFGEDAFEKRTQEEQNRNKRKNASLFEAWTVCIARTSDADAKRLVEQNEQVINKLQQLIAEDEDFFRSISLATQKRDHVRIRHERIKQIVNEVSHA